MYILFWSEGRKDGEKAERVCVSSWYTHNNYVLTYVLDTPRNSGSGLAGESDDVYHHGCPAQYYYAVRVCVMYIDHVGCN